MAAPSTRRLIPLLGTSATWTGSATITGDGQISATGVRTTFGQATIAGNGDWSATGTLTIRHRPHHMGRHVLYHRSHGIRKRVQL